MPNGPNRRHITRLTESVVAPRLVELTAYWRERCADGRLPARADIDPLQLKDLLGTLLLVEVVTEDGRRRFRYRLFGTEFVFYHGRDLTGHYLDEIADTGFRDELLGVYADAVAQRAPQFLAYDYIVDAARHRFQAVLLPLSNRDDGAVDMIFACGRRVAVLRPEE